MQQQIFGNANQHKPQGLTITKAGKQKLSKNQDAFNKLTQKIERLQKDIEEKQLQFNLALKIYGTELYPAQLEVVAARGKLIIVLWDIYKANKLSKVNRGHLKNVLQFHLDEYFEQNEAEPDDLLKYILSEIEGINYDQMVHDQKEEMAADMKEMFKKVNVDMKGVDIDDETAMAQKIAEAKQKLADLKAENDERAKVRQEKKKKTTKQVEQEKMQKAVEEMKQKNISTIYKQLAKLFHPDLEQDAERKVEKEILMKELTRAYEAKNLHTLLTLELRWIHKENDHLESLTEEKLAIYLQILREQARELETTKIRVFLQPQYAALANEFGYDVQRNPVETVKKELDTALLITREFERDIADFTSDVGLRHVNEMLKQWEKNAKEFDDEDELFRLLFG